MAEYGKGRTKRMTTRFTEDEYALVAKAARLAERDPSAWGRLAMLKEARTVIRAAEKEEAGG